MNSGCRQNCFGAAFFKISQKKEPHLEEVEGELMMTVSKWSSLNENDFHLGELSI